MIFAPAMHIHCFAIVSQKSLDFNQICKTNCILYIYGLWMCCNGHQLYYKSHSTLLTRSECRRCSCIDLLHILCRTTKECFTTNMSETSFFLSSNFCSRKPLMLLLMWLQSCHNFIFALWHTKIQSFVNIKMYEKSYFWSLAGGRKIVFHKLFCLLNPTNLWNNRPSLLGRNETLCFINSKIDFLTAFGRARTLGGMGESASKNPLFAGIYETKCFIDWGRELGGGWATAQPPRLGERTHYNYHHMNGRLDEDKIAILLQQMFLLEFFWQKFKRSCTGTHVVMIINDVHARERNGC